jgi:Glycine-rich protein domain (DUF2403)/Putative TOS1-like glycosyl hydrolase (DUF2401)
MRRFVVPGALALLFACGSSGQQGPSTEGPIDAATGSSSGSSSGSSPPPTVDGSPPPPGGDASPPPAQPGLGSATFGPGELDPPSHGGTITFQQIGAAGWYPSRRDPATGPCDAENTSTCCLTKYAITSDALTPWDEDLIMTLRGPMSVKQIAVYQPSSSDPASDWELATAWDSARAAAQANVSFDGKATASVPTFAGGVGSECLVNVATQRPFACGSGSSPFCSSPPASRSWGWSGSKLFVLLATMAHSGTTGAPAQCSTSNTGGWYDAPWIGLSVGELVRAGAFGSCQCYAKDPTKGYLADGCGQFNVFEVVNDNNSYKNLDVFSTDMIDYAGYVGQGPCGPKCNVSTLGAAVDLIDKTNDTEASQGAVATPAGGPSAALRRPETGYRYFIVALDVGTRTVQLGLVHPQNVPAAIAGLLPSLPSTVPRRAVDAVLALRLPQ